MELGYVVLYVKDAETAKEFWIDQCGFHLLKTLEIDGVHVYHIGKDQSNTAIELVPLKLMEGVPMNTGCPSMLFYVDNLAEAHQRLKQKGVKVLDIVEHPPVGKVFTMFDREENAFAVKER